MLFDLTGKRAVVTGAARGIGSASAVALARAGADVAVLNLGNAAGLAETAQAIEAAGRCALTADVDVCDVAQMRDFARHVQAEWGGIDIWVNNAAANLIRPFLDTDPAEWEALLDCNLNGYVHGCRAALPVMVGQETGGRIVNIASVTCIQPPTHMAAYVTAKGGVVALTKALAVEFAQQGVNVNAVAPGAVITPLTQDAFVGEVRRVFEARTAAGRLATPADIAGPIVFLASDAARYIHGQVLVVDGGLIVNGSVSFDAYPART